MSDLYTPAFYDLIRPGVQASAKTVVPIMADWYHTGRVAWWGGRPTVVDVGCGEGWWAHGWAAAGYAASADGIDGPWEGAGSALYHHDNTDYISLDISQISPDGWPLGDHAYSIALCLEVAEHLIEPDNLLVWLRRLAPVVFFSAAVPDQPGAGHVSCRWQADWADSFKDAGWHTADLRPRIWNNPTVDWWYRQNLFVAWDPAGPIRGVPDEPILSVIHPDHWKVRGPSNWRR